MRHKIFLIASFVSLTTFLLKAQSNNKSYNLEASIDVGLDVTQFFQNGLYSGQKQLYPGIYVRPKIALDWNEGRSLLKFEAFGRWDLKGNSRTHWDLRDFYYQYYRGNWDISIGNKKVYWGKTEGVHLVDVINQIDFLEGLDGEEKLGQPMVQVSFSSGIGTFTGFALPYSRRIAFGNKAGRPRTPSVIVKDQVSWQSRHEEWHPTFALRWSHFIADSDLGVHYFYGNARDPLVKFDDMGQFGLQYPVVHQVGLDYQLIVESAIFKLESIYRGGDFDDIWALTGGIEYTFSNVNGVGLDISLIGEYIYDNRRLLTFSSLDNDLFLGSRIAFNNVANMEILFGVFQDLSKSTRLIRLEGSQRIGDNYKITARGQGFFSVDDREFVSLFRRDSFLEMELVRFF